MVDTVAGAKSGAIIYRIAETTKDSNLFHWPSNLPANCQKPGKQDVK